MTTLTCKTGIEPYFSAMLDVMAPDFSFLFSARFPQVVQILRTNEWGERRIAKELPNHPEGVSFHFNGRPNPFNVPYVIIRESVAAR